jgi:hypothetical protein
MRARGWRERARRRAPWRYVCVCTAIPRTPSPVGAKQTDDLTRAATALTEPRFHITGKAVESKQNGRPWSPGSLRPRRLPTSAAATGHRTRHNTATAIEIVPWSILHLCARPFVCIRRFLSVHNCKMNAARGVAGPRAPGTGRERPMIAVPGRNPQSRFRFVPRTAILVYREAMSATIASRSSRSSMAATDETVARRPQSQQRRAGPESGRSAWRLCAADAEAWRGQALLAGG